MSCCSHPKVVENKFSLLFRSQGKRIKLSSPKDEKPYELYIMSFKVTNSNASLAFFAIVDKQVYHLELACVCYCLT